MAHAVREGRKHYTRTLHTHTHTHIAHTIIFAGRRTVCTQDTRDALTTTYIRQGPGGWTYQTHTYLGGERGSDDFMYVTVFPCVSRGVCILCTWVNRSMAADFGHDTITDALTKPPSNW